jgi:hypothetical protein
MRSPRFGVRAVAAGGRRRDGVLNRVPFDWREEGVPVQITVVDPANLAELLPLMRAYCDFYQVAPGDQALLELSQALLAPAGLSASPPCSGPGRRWPPPASG